MVGFSLHSVLQLRENEKLGIKFVSIRVLKHQVQIGSDTCIGESDFRFPSRLLFLPNFYLLFCSSCFAGQDPMVRHHHRLLFRAGWLVIYIIVTLFSISQRHINHYMFSWLLLALFSWLLLALLRTTGKFASIRLEYCNNDSSTLLEV
jgi:hypothetical protein